MSVHPYRGRGPRIDPSAFVAPGARLVGDVELGPEASVWFNAVLRGDSDRVSVGARTNVQDGAVLHTDPGRACVVGEECTVGHRAVVHACTVGSGSLVGMGAVVLSGAVLGQECLVAAGALVPPGRTYPPRSLLIGSPVHRVRTLDDEEVERLIRRGVRDYVRYAADYRDGASAG